MKETEMLESARRAAREAGRIMKDNFGKILTVDETERYDIKLQVDKMCEEAIVSILERDHPGVSILAEERGAVVNESSTARWIIDPLDGTVNFFYGIPAFATSIALEVDGEPTLGVIYDPLRDEMFYAEKGQGAFLNDTRINVSPTSDRSEAVVAIGFMKDDDTIDAALSAMSACIRKIFKVRCLGSAALDMAYVAAGRYTAYYECRIMDWDVAAGRAILSEAGGVYEQKPLGGNSFNIYASNKNLHDNLREFFPLDAVGAAGWTCVL